MSENEIKCMRGIHHHHERVLPFHIGEVVHKLEQAVVSDIKTPIQQIYDQLTKKFVSSNILFHFFLNFFKINIFIAS